MHKQKLLFRVFLTLILVCTNAGLYAYDFQSDDIYYTINNDGKSVSVVSGDAKYKGNVIIPTVVSYNGISYNVTRIESTAFFSCYGLTSITIPNSVTTIASQAFGHCSSLTSITIPNSVTRIESYAFEECDGLMSITIPNSVTYIGHGAFSCSAIASIKVENGNTVYDSRNNCNAIIEKVTNTMITGCKNTTIPSSVTSIGIEAFRHCSGLTSVTIPNSVTSIGSLAFYGCSGLTSIKVESGNTKYDSRNNCNAIIEKATNTLITGCMNTTIPNSVTTIGEDAFAYCNGLTSITIPNSVTTIGEDAFAYCNGLTSITIPNSVTSIGVWAFSGCSGLTSIIIPNSVTSIGEAAFSGCSGLASITVSTGNSKYDSRNNCNAIIEKFSNTLIAGCENTVIPNSVTSIGDRAFGGCSGLTSIIIPNSVTSIGDFTFSGCSGLTSITIPNSVTSIGNSAFTGCSGLTSVISEIQNPFETKENVFSSGTYSKATLTVPMGTKSAYQSTNYWNKFTNIVESSGSSSTNITFADANVKAICVANWDTNSDGELSEEEAAAVKDIGTIFEENTTIKSFDEFQFFTGLEVISYRAFSGCNSLTSITIPNSVTSIGQFAFKSCNGLTSITIPNSVTNIIKWAFSGCSGLTSIMVSSGNTKYDSRNNCNAIIETSSNTLILGCMNTIIPNSVTNIGDEAFENCNGLTSITIPNSVTSIGEDAFADCSGLTHVTIGNSVTSIGHYAFRGCNSLTSITVSGGNTKYDSRNNCNAIIETSSDSLITGCKNTTIPNSVKIIGDYAFYNCSGLTSITIPNSVTSIGGDAFYSCI